jgi:hypothetical protein
MIYILDGYILVNITKYNHNYRLLSKWSVPAGMVLEKCCSEKSYEQRIKRRY